jgi:predicted cupin superfamily sugar epimerase
MPDADTIVRLLELKPHPEGGFFREMFRDPEGSAERAHSTAIYYLLRAGEVSHWHRVDAAEVWHYYAGAPLELSIHDGSAASQMILGNVIEQGQRPQCVVPKGVWQSARSLGDFTLCGCTVAPGFEFAGFELAPTRWQPG